MTNREQLENLSDDELAAVARANDVDPNASRQTVIAELIAKGVGEHPVGDEDEDLSGDERR